MLLFTKKMLGSGQIQESYRGAVSPLLGGPYNGHCLLN